ncbi:MAG: type VI secretion system baseplate subunit TssG [Acidobacteriota bacterium]|nr:type VI secretion system baseplate subunit TssG [Acidobacteriota bacterium]
MAEKALNQKLFDEPERFEFFQAVRLLERLFPERAPVGRDSLPLNEVARFRTRVSLDFPPSQIQEIRETEEEFTEKQKLEIFINFMGMVGAMGAMPTRYTELIIERARYGDTALWNFLDIFTHRTVSLFYRAWEKYRFPVNYERGAGDDFTGYLFDITGLGTAGLRGKLDIDDESLLPYGGLIAQKPHSASAVKNLISDYFKVPAEIEQFSGQWLSLDDESITRLGKTNSSLGANTVLGTKVWDDQSKFRVRLGALGFNEFRAFLPDGTAYKPVKAIIRFMVGQELDFDIQLKLKAKEVPGTILTTRAKRRPMLGWTSFLKTKPFKQDDEQVVLQT